MREKIRICGLTWILVFALAAGVFMPAFAQAAPAKPSVTLIKRNPKSAVIQIKNGGKDSGYQIFFKTSKNGKFRQIMGIRSRSYTIKGLKPNKTYYVKVRAFKTKGYRITTGKFSKVLTIKPYKKAVKPDTNASPGTDASTDTANYAKKVLELVNQERAAVGAAPLVLDETVTAAANVRVKELLKDFSHTRPNGTTPFTALDEAGCSYSTAGENIAAGQATPKEVVESWMNSEGHRKNILNPSYSKLGVGYCTSSDMYGHYWVQLFTN